MVIKLIFTRKGESVWGRVAVSIWWSLWNLVNPRCALQKRETKTTNNNQKTTKNTILCFDGEETRRLYTMSIGVSITIDWSDGSMLVLLDLVAQVHFDRNFWNRCIRMKTGKKIVATKAEGNNYFAFKLFPSGPYVSLNIDLPDFVFPKMGSAPPHLGRHNEPTRRTLVCNGKEPRGNLCELFARNVTVNVYSHWAKHHLTVHQVLNTRDCQSLAIPSPLSAHESPVSNFATVSSGTMGGLRDSENRKPNRQRTLKEVPMRPFQKQQLIWPLTGVFSMDLWFPLDMHLTSHSPSTGQQFSGVVCMPNRDYGLSYVQSILYLCDNESFVLIHEDVVNSVEKYVGCCMTNIKSNSASNNVCLFHKNAVNNIVLGFFFFTTSATVEVFSNQTDLNIEHRKTRRFTRTDCEIVQNKHTATDCTKISWSEDHNRLDIECDKTQGNPLTRRWAGSSNMRSLDTGPLWGNLAGQLTESWVIKFASREMWWNCLQHRFFVTGFQRPFCRAGSQFHMMSFVAFPFPNCKAMLDHFYTHVGCVCRCKTACGFGQFACGLLI